MDDHREDGLHGRDDRLHERDDGLLDRLATDLDRAFDALLVAHQDRIHSIALRLTGDPHDAEEVAQDAFVRAYRALAAYDAERIRALELRAWLATIVVNLCRSRARRHRPLHVTLDAVTSPPSLDRRSDPESVAAARDDRERWARLLLALPPRYREAVVLRHVDGLAYDEMAAALGAPTGTLKARVHRGLELLRAAHDASERAVADPRPATVSRAAGPGTPAAPAAAAKEVSR